MMMKRLALFFSTGYGLKDWKPSGNLSRDLQIYLELLKHNWRTTLITFGGSPDKDLVPEGLELITLNDGEDALKFSRRVAVDFREQLCGMDVIKSHQGMGSGAAAKAARRLRKPFYMRNGYLNGYFSARRGDKPAAYRRTVVEEFFAFHFATVASVPSERQAEFIAKRYWVRRSKLVAHPNWVDEQRFFAPEKRSHEANRTLIFVGRLESQKRPMDMMRALAKVGGIRLILVGQGSLESPCKEIAARENLEVEWIPRVDNDDLPELLSRAGAFILPSEYEGSPKAMMEAMACGLAPISTDGFGVGEWFEDKLEGWKFPVGNVPALISALKDWKQNPEESAKRGMVARRRIERDHTLKVGLERELEILRRLTQ